MSTTEHIPNTLQYVLVLAKNSGQMKATYLMVDPQTNRLLPKPCIVKWPRLTDLIEYRACVLKNVLYIIGGREKSTGRVLRQTIRYDPHSARWKECAKMKKARLNFCATAFNNRIYVIGGETPTGELLATCESYEPLTDDWHKEERLLGSRKDHACVATENAVYLCGGASKAEPYSEHIWLLKKYIPDKRFPERFAYDWFALKDKTQKTLSSKLASHNLVWARNKLFILGGKTKGKQELDLQARRKSKKPNIATNAALEAYRLTPSKHSEKDATVLPSITTKDKVISWNTNQDMEKNYKKKQTQVLLVDNERRKPSQWEKHLPPQPIPRCSAGAIVIGKLIYHIGGTTVEDPSDSVNTVQYYNTKRRRWTTAFPLDGADYRDVECVMLTVPRSNKDFTPVKYGDCKWVMW